MQYQLDASERECLLWIAKLRPGSLEPCSAAVIQRLISRGLIEQVIPVWLPLENLRVEYRLTDAGKKYLEHR